MILLLKRLFSFVGSAGGLLNPTDVAVYQADMVATGILIEERRQTKLARNVIYTCGVMIVVFFIWTSLTPVHEIISGQGQILPGGLVTNIQNLEGGIVSEVMVAPGDRVQVNDILVSIDTTTSRAELAKARARLESVNLSISRLRGLAGGPPAGSSDSDMPSGSIPNSWSLRGAVNEVPLERPVFEITLQRLVDSQAAAAESAEHFRTAQQDVIVADILAKEAELSGLVIEQQKTREELAIINRQLEDYRAALQTGAISRRERDNVEREKLALERDSARLDGQVAAAHVGIDQAKARETELLARIRNESLINITQLETERAETNALIQQLEDRVLRQSITSPVTGIVHVVNFHERGDVISPGDTILEIVPEGGQSFAQVEIPAEKIGNIHVGMEANIKVMTYDFTRFGGIDAIVQYVSPTSVINDEGQPVFQINLQLSSDFVGPESAQRRINPGMTVMADVATGTKSILHYLLRPLRALSDRALTES